MASVRTRTRGEWVGDEQVASCSHEVARHTAAYMRIGGSPEHMGTNARSGLLWYRTRM